MYEVSTETLFLGRQDAMQRQALVPLAEFMRGRAPRGAGTQLLELACGTGRFASFIKARPERARRRSAGSVPSFCACRASRWPSSRKCCSARP